MGFGGTTERKSFGEGVKRGGFGGVRGGDRGGFRGGRGSFGGGRGGSDRGGRGGDRGGRGGFSRGGRGGGDRGRGAPKARVTPFRDMLGVYTLKDSILTKNFSPGETVYGEKKVIENNEEEPGKKIEYRVWNPFRSKIGAALHQNIDELYIKKGDRVLYLGAANGTTVSHVSDIVGEKGIVYAVEFSLRSGRDLEHMSTNRPNIIPIIADARHPANYRLIVGTVDTIFADVAQPDQSRIVVMNAEWYLKNGGHVLISVKASCIDSTATPESVYSKEVEFLRKSNIKPLSQTDLGDFQRGHAMISGQYLPK